MVGPAYDAIIVGAGSVGVPAAWAMSRSGLRALVIDRFASPGQGSNKSAIGGIRATHSEPAKIRLGLRSLEIASTWKERYGDDIEWSTGGYTFVATAPREKRILKDLLSVQQRLGLDIAWYDAAALREIVPSLTNDGLIGGTFAPGDGHCSPLLFCHAVYEHARRAGATFRFRETVTGIETAEGRVRGVVTNRATYHAPIVLNAAGGWARDIGALVGLDHPVQPDAHEAGITEPVAPFLAPMVVDIRPEPGSSNIYFFQHTTGQVVFCMTPDPLVPGFDCRETSGFLPSVARRMARLMPRLVHLRVRRTWRGLYPMTPDGSPLVGWGRDLEGYLMAIGLCGQGFMLGPGLGELLDRVARGETTDEDRAILSELSPHRPFVCQAKLK